MSNWKFCEILGGEERQKSTVGFELETRRGGEERETGYEVKKDFPLHYLLYHIFRESMFAVFE